MIRKLFNTLLMRDLWSIGIVKNPISDFLKPNFKPKINYIQHPEKGKFFADPFGMLKDGKLTILCEDYDFSRGKGFISALAFLADSNSYEKIKALEFPFHASYPFIFEEGGEIYCIPEISAANEVNLYRARDFPLRWEKAATILKGTALLDPTVLFHEGRWWLFASPRNRGSGQLFIWHSNKLLGSWKAHKKNPVKKSISSSRPAGTPFFYKDSLYRPSQDCSLTYGGRIVINKITKLTTDIFEEDVAAVVEPIKGSPFSDGIHTISAAGNFTLLDGKRQVPRFFIK